MATHQQSFLGNNRLVKPVNDTVMALTSYGANAGFEEWHSHENDSISLLLSGTHMEYIQGKKIKRIPGDLKFIPAGVMHRCENYNPGTQKINLDLNGQALQKLTVNDEKLSRLSSQSLPAKFTLLKLYHELTDNSSHATSSAELLLYELFNPASPAKIKTGKQAPLWIERLKELLNDEWDKPFHLDDLSARLGIHPVTISRYFPLYFSATLGGYMQQIKINKALVMIKGTAMPLTEIAYACGFADQAHFTRTFKTITGYLPKEFRKV